jgi:hypothetical protein
VEKSKFFAGGSAHRGIGSRAMLLVVFPGRGDHHRLA